MSDSGMFRIQSLATWAMKVLIEAIYILLCDLNFYMNEMNI